MSQEHSDSAEDTIDYAAPRDDDVMDQYFGPSPVPILVDFAARSHPGKVRSRNEDHYAVIRRRRSRAVLLTNLPDDFPRASNEDAYTMVVADGMGGHAFGDVASILALRMGWEFGREEISWTLKSTERVASELMEKLELYPVIINRALRQRARERPELSGMGTTFTGFYIVGEDAFVSHVGDSRAYLFRDGKLQALTKDQTLAQELIDAGVFEPESDDVQKTRHILTGSLGDHPGDVHAETRRFRLHDSDWLMLCTDGLTDMVGETQIGAVIANHPPDEAADLLIDLALEAGGKDNVTVVLGAFRVPPPGSDVTRV